MKAIIYHADAKPLWDAPAGMYQKLFDGFKQAAHKFQIEVVHLTLEGFPGWGDVSIFCKDLDPANIVYNREVCFTEFLKNAPDDTYWFTEPDARIVQKIPGLNGDLALLFRKDDVPMSPSFRLARKSALPFFEEILETFVGPKDWHGDSATFNAMYARMRKPQIGRVKYNGMRIEFRDYNGYSHSKGRFVTHHKFTSKRVLL